MAESLAGSRLSRWRSAAVAFSVASSFAREDVVHVEPQQPVVRPLPAFEQQHAAAGEDEQPARGMVLGEQPAGDDGFPRLVQYRFRRRRFAVELEGVGLEAERVFAFVGGIERAEGEQARGAGGCAIGTEDRHFGTVFQREVGRLATVAESTEQPYEPLPLPQDALAGPPLSVESPRKRRYSGARARSSAHGVRAFADSACSCQRSSVPWMSPAKFSAR